MKYTTTVTSKGTITIAAQLRKDLKIRPGQKVRMHRGAGSQLVVDIGTNMAEFEKVRREITSKLPKHEKALSGQTLKDAAAEAWVAGYGDKS